MYESCYSVPDHPALEDVYTRDELRTLLREGQLSRSDMVYNDDTGLAHMLGDLLAPPYPRVAFAPTRSTQSSVEPAPIAGVREFRGDTPLTSSPVPPQQPRSFTTSSFEERVQLAQHQDDPFEDEYDHVTFPNPHLTRKRPLLKPEIPHADFQPPWYKPNPTTNAIPLESVADLTELEETLDDEADAFEESHDLEEEELIPHHEFNEDEELFIYIGSPHFLAFPKCLLSFLCLASSAYAAFHYQWGIAWIALLASLACLCIVYIVLIRTTTEYVVSNFRVQHEFGFISFNASEILIKDISRIEVRQSGILALLKIGHIKFESTLHDEPSIVFENIRHPHKLKEQLRYIQIHGLAHDIQPF